MLEIKWQSTENIQRKIKLKRHRDELTQLGQKTTHPQM